MRKQIQTAELRIMMQKRCYLVKNRRDREEKSVPPVFFLTGGRDEKMHRKRAKKNEKICKKFLAFPGTKCYTIKRTFARGLFSNPQKKTHSKSLQQKIPYTGAKEQRKEDSS